MKNFIFKSSNDSDLSKMFQLKLELIQKELRHQRDEHAQITKDLSTIVKGIALLVSVPEEDLDPTNHSPDGD